MVHYLPCGTKNLQQIFPFVDWPNVQSYYVQAKYGESTLITTGEFIICRCEDILRIHFLNTLGTIDTINLKNIGNTHSNDSKSFIKAQPGAFDLQRHAISRYDVNSNNTFTGYKILSEDKVKYYEELFDSPLAWMEINNMYLPIVILDGSIEEMKQDDRFMYELTVSFSYSKSKKIIRG